MNKIISKLTFFFFFLVLLSSFSYGYYVTRPAGSIFSDQDGYEIYSYGASSMCQTTAGSTNRIWTQTGFDCVGSGLWDETVTPTYVTTSTDYHVIPPLISELENVTNPRVSYMVRFTPTQMFISYYNITLNNMVEKASKDLNENLIRSSDTNYYTSPIIYKPFSHPRPVIATIETNVSANPVYFVHLYDFNSTHITELCHRQLLHGGDDVISARLSYDDSYTSGDGYLVVSLGMSGTTRTYLQRINAYSCAYSDYLEVTHSYYAGYPQATIGDTGLSDGYTALKTYIDGTVNVNNELTGLNIWTYNLTHITQPTSWDGNCDTGALGINNCDCTNGICTELGEYIEDMSIPIMLDTDANGYDNIIVAFNDRQGSIWNYNIMIMDRYGKANRFLDTNAQSITNCGKSNTNKNVTGWQPVITSHPSATIPTNSLYNVANAVCGACQPPDSNTLYIECFDIFNGESLASNSIELSDNYYRSKKTSGQPRLLNMLSYNIDSSTPEPEIIISDMIFDINLNLIKRIGFMESDTVVMTGKLIPFSEYNTNDTQIILWTNQTTRIYKTGKENELPSFVTSGNSVNPPITDNVICLNFTKDYGLNIQYVINNLEVASEVEYYRYWCNYPNFNEVNQTYNTFLNWTSITENNNNIYTTLNCKYNTTGTKTFRIEFSDEYHYNLSVPTYINDDFSLQIIDNNAPLCVDE